MNNKFLTEKFNLNPKAIELCFSAEEVVKPRFGDIDAIAEINQYKVIKAMQDNMLSDSHFGYASGYGYNDVGRDVLESIYSSVFGTESALARVQIISGTHALSLAMASNLKYGDELIYVTGTPYDTLLGVIGCRPARGSLIENGVVYKEISLMPNGNIDFDSIAKTITPKTKMVGIQRSKGYSWRNSFSIEDISQIISLVKSINKNIICMVDNCYGEFVEQLEPSDVGADLTVGSMIKNPGGGLAPVGGYIVGNEDLVENAAARLSSPGVGREAGPSLGVASRLLQGLFLAPTVVASSLKGAILAAEVYKQLGFSTLPNATDYRTCIVQALQLNSPKSVIAFCKGIQKAAAVDSFVTPEPWQMPGYDCPVIMAAGTFIQGASIELSADAPIRPPYNVFMQGGLTYPHAKLGVIFSVNELMEQNLI